MALIFSYGRHDRCKRLLVFNQHYRSCTTLNSRATNMLNANKCELIDYLQDTNSTHDLHVTLNDRAVNNSYCRHDRRK